MGDPYTNLSIFFSFNAAQVGIQSRKRGSWLKIMIGRNESSRQSFEDMHQSSIRWLGLIEQIGIQGEGYLTRVEGTEARLGRRHGGSIEG